MGVKLLSDIKFTSIFTVVVALLFMTPILPQPLKIAAIGIFLVICFFNFFTKKPTFKWKFFLINSCVYIVYILSLLYTDNLLYGLRKLEVSAALVVFPLGFALVSRGVLNNAMKQIKVFFYVYITSVVSLNIALILLFLTSGYSWSGFLHYSDFVNAIDGFPGIHPMYLSMHNCIAIILVIYLLRTERFLKAGVILYIVGFSLGIGLILLLQKGPIFALLVTSTILCFKYSLQRIWAFYLIIILSMGSVVIAFPSSMQRLNTLFTVENFAGIKESAEIRKTLRSCNAPTLKEAGILGFGAGDGNEKLISCYENIDRDLAAISYNSHNQYVGLILMIGLLGLLLFLFFLFFNINHALKSGIFLPIAVIMFYAIVMFSENILERQEGVIYFSLLINFLYFLSKENQQTVRVKNTQEEILKAMS